MAQFSGQVTLSNIVATQLPSIQTLKVTFAAHPSNSGVAWVGNDGNDTISALTGYPLRPAERVTVVLDGDLNELYAIADYNNEKLCWLLTNK